MATLTNANSVLMLAVAGVFPVPQQLQGFSTDDAFTVSDVVPVETAMGVDGLLSAGYTPYPTEIEITLQADSPSISIFDTWKTVQDTAREVFFANMTVSIPGTGQKFACTRGAMTGASPMPTGKKILQPRKWKITFQSVTPSPV
ncbi:MAG: hypothetical protein EPN62_00780 [Candidimonas sp.]|nr:MAG: hypothetical protein EPN77_01780 [Candidimonas sp.]TAM26865.1 MAG: hypothetical protein EPN62_00780 [Candidimonas sp.]